MKNIFKLQEELYQLRNNLRSQMVIRDIELHSLLDVGPVDMKCRLACELAISIFFRVKI